MNDSSPIWLDADAVPLTPPTKPNRGSKGISRGLGSHVRVMAKRTPVSTVTTRQPVKSQHDGEVQSSSQTRAATARCAVGDLGRRRGVILKNGQLTYFDRRDR